jgi:hypothetical protein
MNNLERQQRESVIEITPTTLQDYFGILIEAVRNGERFATTLNGSRISTFQAVECRCC